MKKNTMIFVAIMDRLWQCCYVLRSNSSIPFLRQFYFTGNQVISLSPVELVQSVADNLGSYLD